MKFWHQQDPLEAYWGRLSGSFTIVPAAFLSDDGREAATGWGELKALNYIASILYSFRRPGDVDIFVPAGRNHIPDLGSLAENVIVIGGPVSNPMAAKLLEPAAGLGVPFCFDDFSLIAPPGYGESESYGTVLLEADNPYSVKSDTGCIIHRQIELADGRSRRVWLFMGCHTYGSYGAAVAAFSKEFCARALESGKGRASYDLIVKVDDLDNMWSGNPGHTKIRVEPAGTMPGIGPILNSADIDTVLSEVAFGARFEHERARKKLANTLASICLFLLGYPYLLKFIALLFSKDG